MLATPYNANQLRTAAPSQQQEAHYVPLHQHHTLQHHHEEQQQQQPTHLPQYHQQHHFSHQQQQQQQQQQQRHVLADRYKTKMCRNYTLHGECPYETRCMFAHGDHEMRTTEQNLRDGLTTEENIKAFQRAANNNRKNGAQSQRSAAVLPTPPPAASVTAVKTNQNTCECEQCQQQQPFHYQQPHAAATAAAAPSGLSDDDDESSNAGRSATETPERFAHNPYAAVVLLPPYRGVAASEYRLSFADDVEDVAAMAPPVVEDWAEWCDEEEEVQGTDTQQRSAAAASSFPRKVVNADAVAMEP